jgi:hypothetical protein
MQAPVIVMSRFGHIKDRERILEDSNSLTDTGQGDRQVGRKAQISNITAAKTYAPIPLLHVGHIDLGQCIRHHSIMPGTKSHVENAP